MTFVPRTFTQILEDMVIYVQTTTTISDFTVGSVARTFLEAAALEDDEQYFQMAQLLDAFSVATSRGEELDRRLADYGIVRLSPTTATARVRIYDTNLITEQLSLDAALAATSITMFSTGDFPTSGFPYTIRLGEGTTRAQDASVTANSTSTGVLTLSAGLANAMVVGDRVSLVTGASSHTINTGSSVQAPPTVNEAPKLFSTQEPAFIAAGNFFSNEVVVKAQQGGTAGNVGSGRISQFLSGAPFAGAGVTNTSAASGGSNRESDFHFRQRALDQIQAMSRGTPLAVKSAAIGVTDVNTGQTTVSANLVEDFVADEIIVYIDDGTGLVPDINTLANDTLSTGGGVLALGASTLVLASTASFPSSGTVLILVDSLTNPAELITYTSKNDITNTLNLATATTIDHDDGTTVLFIDQLTTSAESGRRRFSIQNPPVVRGTDRVFVNPGSGWVEYTPTTDYILNRGTGDLQVVSTAGLGVGSQLVAHYGYYTNLIRTVQKVLEGTTSTATYPGVKASGVFLSVEAPIIRRITVVASISAETGFTESDLSAPVRLEIETYLNSLKIGDDVIYSKIIDVAHNVRGVQDIFISLPSGNISILESELPVPYAADGTSLVTVL